MTLNCVSLTSENVILLGARPGTGRNTAGKAIMDKLEARLYQ